MSTEQERIRAYMEANSRVMSLATDGQQITVSILNTFLGAARWGLDAPGTKEPHTLEFLAEKLHITPTTLSQQLRYLGDRYRTDRDGLGLVDLNVYPLNRRQKTFSLTHKGKALRDQIVYILDK